VDPSDWEKVARATGVAPLAARIVNRHPGGEKLRDRDDGRLSQYEAIFMAASAALKPLAEEGP
jgi:hypothetical protein